MRGWEELFFFSKSSVGACVSASVPASAHGEAMRTLVIHKINFGPNPQRRLSVPVLMISSVLHSPNILYVSIHTPPCERPQIWVIFSAGKEERGGGKRTVVDISTG